MTLCQCETNGPDKNIERIKRARLKEKIGDFIKIGFRSAGETVLLQCLKCQMFWEVKMHDQSVETTKKTDQSYKLKGAMIEINISDYNINCPSIFLQTKVILGKIVDILQIDKATYAVMELANQMALENAKVTSVMISPRHQGCFLSDLMSLDKKEFLVVDIFADIQTLTSKTSHKMIGEATLKTDQE